MSAATCAECRFGGDLVDVVHVDARAFAIELPRNSLPNPGPPSRNERNLILESHRKRVSAFRIQHSGSVAVSSELRSEC